MQLDGVLFFPVTPFTGDRVATDVLGKHIAEALPHRPGGVFAACGTGEGHALSTDEVATVARAVVAATAGAAPVIVGAGGSLPDAVERVRRAAEAGADGILLLPPYMASGPPEGTLRYVEAVADASELPIIVYQRGTALFTPETAVAAARHPRVVGLKDASGDVDRMQRLVLAVRQAVGDDFQFFNGLPTAEITVPAYRGFGVHLYSSSTFCFAPEISSAFYDSLVHHDGALSRRLLAEFYRPLVELRDRVPGYAVSLVKCGVRLRGLDVGPVRPPLTEPANDHVDRLREIIDAGLHCVGKR